LLSSLTISYQHIIYVDFHLILLFFFSTNTATTEIYTLSLHDALPIFDDGGRLAAADALGLAGDADGAAADADLDKVCPGLGQEEEAVAVHHVARAHLDLVAVVLADPAQGAALPLREALGRVDAQHVHAGIHQGGHPLGVVAGIDARAHHIALAGVQQLVGILLVGVVVLAEHEVLQAAFLIHQ